MRDERCGEVKSGGVQIVKVSSQRISCDIEHAYCLKIVDFVFQGLSDTHYNMLHLEKIVVLAYTDVGAAGRWVNLFGLHF